VPLNEVRRRCTSNLCSLTVGRGWKVHHLVKDWRTSACRERLPAILIRALCVWNSVVTVAPLPIAGTVNCAFLVVLWSQFTLRLNGATVAFAVVVFGSPAPVVMIEYGAVA
jgi:hypothetical protein